MSSISKEHHCVKLDFLWLLEVTLFPNVAQIIEIAPWLHRPSWGLFTLSHVPVLFFMCNAGIKKEVNRLKIERETCQNFVLDVDEIWARPALIQDVFVAQRKNIDESISSNEGDKVWLTRQQKCRFNHYCSKNVQKINNKNRCLRLKVNFLPR